MSMSNTEKTVKDIRRTTRRTTRRTFSADENIRVVMDGQEIFNIPMAEIGSLIEPGGVADDIRRESVRLVSIHQPVLEKTASSAVSTNSIDIMDTVMVSVAVALPGLVRSEQATQISCTCSTTLPRVRPASD